jgi:hypothetical protein
LSGDDNGGSIGGSSGSVTRDRGSAGVTDDGGGPTVGVGDDPSDIDVGPNPRSPVDDSDGDSSSSDVGSVTRDRGSAGVTDDGGGPTVGLDDLDEDITITGTVPPDDVPDIPPIAPDLVGDGTLEEALDDLNITLPGSNAGNSGSGLSLWLLGGIVAVLGVVLLGGNYGDS